MKRAVIFHGTDASPSDHWLSWMKSQFEASGYEVFAPELPNCHTPNHQTYEQFLRDSSWDFTNNVLVGHSSGATTILNLLSLEWLPRVKAAVLVGTFLNEKLTKNADWYDPGQFDELFLKSYNPELIRQKAGSFYFVHGDDDPYCEFGDAEILCEKLGGTFIVVAKGHHLGDSSGITELPELANILHRDRIL